MDMHESGSTKIDLENEPELRKYLHVMMLRMRLSNHHLQVLHLLHRI